MTTFESLWTEYQPIIAGVAYEHGGRNHRYGASHEDFSQEFALWMMDNEDFLAEKREEITDPDEFGRFLARCLHNEGADYGLDIRDAAGGQPRRGAYWYTTNELKVLLPCVFDPQKWLEPPQSDGRSVGDPAHGGNWIATLADVAQALSRLEHTDQMLLRALHEDGLRNKDLADADGVTEATMSYRHTQALKRLLKNLGGEKPRKMRADSPYDPWRGRHAVSNAGARAVQGGYYDD